MSFRSTAKWDHVQFGSLVSHSAFGPRFSGDAYSPDGNVATMRTTDLDDDGRIDYDGMPLALLNEDSFANHILKPGDMVITRSGTCGIAAVFQGFDLPVLPGAFLIRFRFGDQAAPDFYRYYFNSALGRQNILSVARGAVQQNLNITNVERLLVPHPSLSEQQQIVDRLSAYDDLMENNRRRMALLEESARLLYREWFVHLRFPGHEHTRLINGLPEGWERVPLGEVMTLQRGHDLPSQDRVEGDIPIVSSSGITGFHDKKKADAPGVVTGRYGTLGQVYYIDRDYWPLNTALYVTDFKSNPPPYILHLLKHALESIQSDKAAIPGLNRNVVHSMNVLRPPAALRAAFGDFAADVYRQISLLTDQTQKLRTARDLLLPRLMSGEIEV
jgi:type I restriction enzyme S subunit